MAVVMIPGQPPLALFVLGQVLAFFWFCGLLLSAGGLGFRSVVPTSVLGN